MHDEAHVAEGPNAFARALVGRITYPRKGEH